jgi:hypothetical protein
MAVGEEVELEINPGAIKEASSKNNSGKQIKINFS